MLSFYKTQNILNSHSQTDHLRIDYQKSLLLPFTPKVETYQVEDTTILIGLIVLIAVDAEFLMMAL